MRAILCEAWGEPETLKLGELPNPRWDRDRSASACAPPA